MGEERQPDAFPLSRLPEGASARVARIAGSDPQRMLKLSSLGIVPGARVLMRQHRPAAVIQVGETTVALDPEIGSEIWVTRLP